NIIEIRCLSGEQGDDQVRTGSALPPYCMSIESIFPTAPLFALRVVEIAIVEEGFIEKGFVIILERADDGRYALKLCLEVVIILCQTLDRVLRFSVMKSRRIIAPSRQGGRGLFFKLDLCVCLRQRDVSGLNPGRQCHDDLLEFRVPTRFEVR